MRTPRITLPRLAKAAAAALATLLLAAGMAQAQTAPAAKTGTTALSPNAQYAADSKQLQARYQSDLATCNSEASSAGRMQCKRDAKADYDKALAEAKARMTAAKTPAAPQAACLDCGKVASVTQEERQGEGSAMGLIAGGVVGGLLGNQVGGGRGRDLATLAGAAGGAYAGREVEKRVNTHKVWVVRVTFPNNEAATYEFAQDPGLKAGDGVRKSDKTVVKI